MYHYRACGLDNVWLADGYEWVQTAYGRALRIPKVKELHRAIGRFLIAKPRLTGREFRWVRVALDLSQAALGDMFGVTDQAVAKWEKGRGAPKLADRALRALYREHLGGNVKLQDIFARAESRAESKAATEAAKVVRLKFAKSPRGWRLDIGDTKRAA